jgi:hypothetical protein
MLGAHKAKEMKRRASQRKAAHKARLAALTLASSCDLAAASQTSLLSKFAATVEEPEYPDRIVNKSSFHPHLTARSGKMVIAPRVS